MDDCATLLRLLLHCCRYMGLGSEWIQRWCVIMPRFPSVAAPAEQQMIRSLLVIYKASCCIVMWGCCKCMRLTTIQAHPTQNRHSPSQRGSTQLALLLFGVKDCHAPACGHEPHYRVTGQTGLFLRTLGREALLLCCIQQVVTAGCVQCAPIGILTLHSA